MCCQRQISPRRHRAAPRRDGEGEGEEGGEEEEEEEEEEGGAPPGA